MPAVKPKKPSKHFPKCGSSYWSWERHKNTASHKRVHSFIYDKLGLNFNKQKQEESQDQELSQTKSENEKLKEEVLMLRMENQMLKKRIESARLALGSDVLDQDQESFEEKIRIQYPKSHKAYEDLWKSFTEYCKREQLNPKPKAAFNFLKDQGERERHRLIYCS